MRVDVSGVPRWWRLAPDAHAPIDEEGFLREAHGGLTLDELRDTPCLVLLGDAGFGKSTTVHAACESLRARGESCRVRELGAAEGGGDLRTFIREALAVARAGAVHHLFLDGLDEALTNLKGFGATIVDELSGDLDALQRLRLRITCRAAAMPKGLPDRLARIYDKEQVALHTLMPLRWSDVESLVRSEREADADEILPRLRKRPLAALAARPITLKLLLEPRTRATRTATTAFEVFDEAMEALLVDPDADRRGESHGLLARRREVASSLAVATLLGGRLRIVASAVPVGPLHDAVTTADLDGAVTGDELRSLIKSAPLFGKSAPLFEEAWFAHRNFAEFLAAARLASNASPDEVVARLFLPEVATTRIVPQLRGVAAWLGLRRRFFDRLLARDPITLLEVDPAFLDDAQRSRLIEATLDRADELHMLGGWHRGSDLLAGFEHADLAAQLRRWMLNFDVHPRAREIAIEIAREAGGLDLARELAGIAVSDQHEPRLRATAARAVRQLGDETAIHLLRPLVDGSVPEVDDELKGIALDALWPRWIDAATMFAALTTRKDDSYFGAYADFLMGVLPRSLTVEHAVVALRWCASNAGASRRWPPEDLVKRALALGAEQIESPEVGAALVECVRAMSASHEDPIEHLVTALQSMGGETRDRRRWALLELLVPHAGDDRAGQWLRWHLVKLLVPVDTLPLIERAERDDRRDAVPWLRLAAELYQRSEARDPTITERLLAYQSEDADPIARAELKHLWEAQPIDGDNARSHREQRQREQAAEACQGPARTQRAERIRAFVTRAAAGDLDAFWEAVVGMNTRVRDDGLVVQWHQTRLDHPEAWGELDGEHQRALLRAAVSYLTQRGPEAEAWFAEGILHWPAVAGRQALVLLGEREPSALESLGPGDWARWTPALLSPAWVSEEAPRAVVGDLLRRAYASDRTAYQQNALALLRVEAHAYPFSIDVIEPVVDLEFANELRHFVETSPVSADTLGRVLGCVARCDETLSGDLARDVIAREWDAPDEAGARAVRAAAHLLDRNPDTAWPTLRPRFERAPERGAQAVQFADQRARAGVQWSPPFSTAPGLASFYRWGVLALHAMPAARSRRSGLVTPRDVLAWCIPRVRDRLVTLGTEEALSELDTLRADLPEETDDLSRALLYAREYYLERSWRGWPVRDLLATFCATRPDKRPSPDNSGMTVEGAGRLPSRGIEETPGTALFLPPPARELTGTPNPSRSQSDALPSSSSDPARLRESPKLFPEHTAVAGSSTLGAPPPEKSRGPARVSWRMLAGAALLLTVLVGTVVRFGPWRPQHDGGVSRRPRALIGQFDGGINASHPQDLTPNPGPIALPSQTLDASGFNSADFPQVRADAAWRFWQRPSSAISVRYHESAYFETEHACMEQYYRQIPSRLIVPHHRYRGCHRCDLQSSVNRCTEQMSGTATGDCLAAEVDKCLERDPAQPLSHSPLIPHTYQPNAETQVRTGEAQDATETLIPPDVVTVTPTNESAALPESIQGTFSCYCLFFSYRLPDGRTDYSDECRGSLPACVEQQGGFSHSVTEHIEMECHVPNYSAVRRACVDPAEPRQPLQCWIARFIIRQIGTRCIDAGTAP